MSTTEDVGQELSAGAPPGAARALDRAVARLLDHQSEHGWWWGRMRTNVTLDVEDLLLQELYGTRTPETTAAVARWIRSEQREDGTWATFPGGPGDLSTTVEAYAALRLAGDGPDEAHMLRAARFCREAGGVEASRMATRTWLAVCGQWSWRDLPALPPEVALVPHRFPLSIRDLSGWSRIALLPLAIANAHRPVHPLPFDLTELRSGRAAPRPRVPLLSVPRLFYGLDAVLRRYQERPLAALRRRALRRAEEWILDHQEADGTWLGVHLLSVFCLLGLHAAGYPVHHPAVRRGLEGLRRFEVWDDTADGPTRRMECVTGPVWDTSLAVVALTDAGVPADHPAVQAAGRWLLREEIGTLGDWKSRRGGLRAGGWAFSFDNDIFPDCDDTAAVLMALQRVAGADDAERAALAGARQRGTDWLRGMQSRGGGWASYDADNDSALAGQLPFCDFGEATDPPSADVSAHVLEALSASAGAGDPVLRRGVRWLLGQQEDDGSWFGRWGVNHVYGTWCAVTALRATGLPPQHPALARARGWLLAHQGPDGGWGEDIRSYTDPAWVGRGAPTPSQTAWSLLALHALDEPAAAPAVARGLQWLVENQTQDGGWDEDVYTGTGFPGDFYMGYPLYRQVFPTTALARWVRQAPEAAPPAQAPAGETST